MHNAFEPHPPSSMQKYMQWLMKRGLPALHHGLTSTFPATLQLYLLDCPLTAAQDTSGVLRTRHWVHIGRLSDRASTGGVKLRSVARRCAVSGHEFIVADPPLCPVPPEGHPRQGRGQFLLHNQIQMCPIAINVQSPHPLITWHQNSLHALPALHPCSPAPHLSCFPLYVAHA